jgi:hypothetical protein
MVVWESAACGSQRDIRMVAFLGCGGDGDSYTLRLHGKHHPPPPRCPTLFFIVFLSQTTTTTIVLLLLSKSYTDSQFPSPLYCFLSSPSLHGVLEGGVDVTSPSPPPSSAHNPPSCACSREKCQPIVKPEGRMGKRRRRHGKESMEGARAIVHVNMLVPTQPVVGYAQVESQRRRLDRKLRSMSGERGRAVRKVVYERKTVPVVLGPGGRKCYIIDRHHWARAVLESKRLHESERRVMCEVVGDMSGFRGEEEFWAEMQRRGWAYCKMEGHAISWQDLPTGCARYVLSSFFPSHRRPRPSLPPFGGRGGGEVARDIGAGR